MNKTPRGSSLFPGVLNFFKHQPSKVKTQTVRKRSARILAEGKKQAAPDKPDAYRSAEIKFKDCACDAVKEMEGKRFLSCEVPLIPLPDCTSPNCKCTYIRHKDRRDWSEDRRASFISQSNQYTAGGNGERRAKVDRRADAESNFAEFDEIFDFDSWDK